MPGARLLPATRIHGVKSMKLGSLFDGSGGFPLAGRLCGIKPVWASEVEPYPIAVTRSRFPNMKHLGDVNKVSGAEIEPVDIITFGSPCQDLSVAGKRAGIKDGTRSGLFLEAIRIIKEMRETTGGMYPTFALWENVPGAFSSNNGEDFRTVLQEFVKIKEPSAVMPPVPAGGWAYADSYMGDGWSLAYRTLDAQYWGVPQRRRRIYLVADLAGGSAGKILFESEGVSGYTPHGFRSWQGAARASEKGSGAAGCVCLNDQGGGKGSLIQDDKSATLGCNNDQTLFVPTVFGICSKESNSMKSSNPHSGIYKAETSRTLDGNGGNPLCNQGGMAVVEVQGSMIGRADKNGPQGSGVNEDVSFTLDAADRHAVAYCMTTGSYTQTLEEQSPTLMARDYKDPPVVNETEPEYIVRRLTPTECARLQGFPDKWGHPDHKDDFTDDEYQFWVGVRNTHAAINGKAERQYTKEQMLTWYNKLHTDSAEYRMWGNGIALPTALYVMQGIVEELTNDVI